MGDACATMQREASAVAVAAAAPAVQSMLAPMMLMHYAKQTHLQTYSHFGTLRVPEHHTVHGTTVQCRTPQKHVLCAPQKYVLCANTCLNRRPQPERRGSSVSAAVADAHAGKDAQPGVLLVFQIGGVQDAQKKRVPQPSCALCASLTSFPVHADTAAPCKCA